MGGGSSPERVRLKLRVNEGSVERNLSQDLKVGLFVLFSLLLGGVAVYMLGGSSKMFEDRYTLYTALDDVGGMRVGAVVRLAGIDVGEVTEISFNDVQEAHTSEDLNKLLPAERAQFKPIHITISLMTKFAPKIRENSIARVETEGMLGDKYLSISIGSPRSSDKGLEGEVIQRTHAELVDGDWLAATESTPLVEYEKIANAVLADLKEISRKVNMSLGTDQEVTQASVANVVQSVEELLVAAKEGKGLIHALVYDDALARRLGSTVSNLETTSGEFASISREVRTGDSIAHELIYGESGEELATQLGSLAEQLERIVGDIETQDSLVHALIYDPERAQMVEDLHATATSLRALSATIESGEGTVGMLANDPALYEDLRALVGGAQRNKLLRAYIRQTVEQGEANNAQPWTPPQD